MGIPFVIFFILATSYLFQSDETQTIEVKPENSAHVMVVPTCSKARPQLRRIAGGKYGLQFDVPKGEVSVLGGKWDVDYVRYVIKPKTGDGYLEFWFGPTAMGPEPDKELLENSVGTQRGKIVTAKGKQIGTDSSGKLRTGEVWRHTFFAISGAEGARYQSGQENVPLFNQIIDSACYIPYPKP